MLFYLRYLNNKIKVYKKIEELKRSKIVFKNDFSNFSVKFIVDYFPINKKYCGEPGVSYLLEAGGKRILFDLGLGKYNNGISTLTNNMKLMGINPEIFDSVFISHNHPDHMGGNLRFRCKNPGLEEVGIYSKSELKVYTPIPMKSELANCINIEKPQELFPGIATTGPIPATLYFIGNITEQALIVSLKNNQSALIIGCGHPQVINMVKIANEITSRKVRIVVGGLHLIVSKGRTVKQKYLASNFPPWKSFKKDDIVKIANELKELGVKEIAPSAHDSCDTTLNIFQDIFGKGYHVVKAGGKLEISYN